MFIRARSGGRRVHSGSLGSFGRALRVVGFILGPSLSSFGRVARFFRAGPRDPRDNLGSFGAPLGWSGSFGVQLGGSLVSIGWVH